MTENSEGVKELKEAIRIKTSVIGVSFFNCFRVPEDAVQCDLETGADADDRAARHYRDSAASDEYVSVSVYHELDAAAAPDLSAKTDFVIELQSALESQPTNKTHSIMEPPQVSMTLTTGTQSVTIAMLSIAVPTQTTETSPIVAQLSNTVTFTIAVFSETADLRSAVASVLSTTLSSSAVTVLGTETATINTFFETSFEHRPETQANKREAMATAASEKKYKRQPMRSYTSPRFSKKARLATFEFAGCYFSDSSIRPLQIESLPAAESFIVIVSEFKTRSMTLFLTPPFTAQQPSDSAPPFRILIGEPA